MKRTILARLAVGVILLFGFAAGLHAQVGSFGENKIQYRRFDWRVIHGPHVDLYFYPAEAKLAPKALSYAEESYDFLSLKFGHTVSIRIPLIIYASFNDFEQTNVLPFTPPEGLLGVTDFLKRRVTLPFRGNVSEFRHTMRHEMVHVFQLSLATDTYNRSPRAAQIPQPLWWSEGLAEYWSAGEDARDEMILRDLVLSGNIPSFKQLAYASGGIVYPIGGRIHRWLAQTYGDWRAAYFYKDAWRYESFDDAIRGVYGRSLDQLSEEWKVAMQRAYFPATEGHAPLSTAARTLARYALQPALLPNDSAGTDHAPDMLYVSPANGYMTIYRKNIDGGRARAVVTAGRSAQLESFHPFESRIDASRRGYVLFTSKANDRDALIMWDMRKGKEAGRYQFPHLVSIISPVWSPDFKSILFSGLSESGTSDLYRLYLNPDSLEQVTNDPYQDIDPSPSPDGRRVVFASDRTEGGLQGAVNLFVRDLATGTTTQLTSGHWVDETPRWEANGRIYFTSDRDGVLNIFSVDTLGEGRRETSAWTGAFGQEYVPERNALLVSGFHELALSVYYYPADSAAERETFALTPPAPEPAWDWPATTAMAEASSASAPYRRHYTVDFLAGDAVFIPRVGGSQGVTLFASDLLSDNLLYFNFLTFQGKRFGSIFDNINIFGIYINQTHRVNWGIGAFRSRGSFLEGDLSVAYTEKADGVLGLVRYPLSRYTRLEGQMVVEHSDRTDFTLPVDQPRRVGWIASHYLSFVHDNTIWDDAGPIDGMRVNFTAGTSTDFSNSRFDSYLLSGDYRLYTRIARRAGFATRLFGFYSGGDRPQRVNIGGTLGIRGYPLYGYILGSRAFMVNEELRFPLLDFFTLGAPFGSVRFPGVQGALFVDAGKASFNSAEHRALLGSYGLSFRWPLTPLAVLRLDWGRRFTDNDYVGYGLSSRQTKRNFVAFFFGYNY
ncbi:MAG: hypothetical protein ABJD11_09125 [Gemmatimonadota bacterium]